MIKRVKDVLNNEKGMEMVQVGILIAIAIGVGMLFKTQIVGFINSVFTDLNSSSF